MVYDILIVDDEPQVLGALQRTIGLDADVKSNIVLALNAEEALRELEAREFALVISDYKMPGMNGVDLLAVVQERYPRTMRVLITGYSDVAIARDAINHAKIDYYVEKPWDNEELQRTVGRLLHLFSYKREVGLSPREENAVGTGQRFSLEPGYIYMMPERKGERTFEILADLVTHGHQGLGITIQSPEVLRKRYGFERTRLLYMGKEKHGEEWVDASDLVEIGIIVRSFLKEAENGVVVLDGLEYLITSFTFDTIVKLVQNLYEFNTFNNSLIIIPINPNALEKKEMAILERYLEPVKEERPVEAKGG